VEEMIFIKLNDLSRWPVEGEIACISSIKREKLRSSKFPAFKLYDEILFFDFSAKLPSRFPAGISALHPLSCLDFAFFCTKFLFLRKLKL